MTAMLFTGAVLVFFLFALIWREGRARDKKFFFSELYTRSSDNRELSMLLKLTKLDDVRGITGFIRWRPDEDLPTDYFLAKRVAGVTACLSSCKRQMLVYFANGTGFDMCYLSAERPLVMEDAFNALSKIIGGIDVGTGASRTGLRDFYDAFCRQYDGLQRRGYVTPNTAMSKA
jgi:hypothetical protein